MPDAKEILCSVIVYKDGTTKTIPAEVAEPVTRGWLGMNLNNLRDFDPQQAFSDAVKTARIDLNGVPLTPPFTKWLTGNVRIWLARDIKPVGGRWVIQIQGGKVNPPAPAALEVSEGKAHVYLDLKIEQPPDAIRIYRPGCDGSSLFNPAFLNLISPFKGAIRFMDWLGINSSPVVNWADQPGPDSITFNGPDEVPSRGSYAHAIDLCNGLTRDPWLNIPHKATANVEFSRSLGNLCRQRLNPDLRPFVEFTNEHWNTGGPFQQSHDLFEEAQRKAATTHPQLKAGAENEWDIWHRWFAWLTANHGATFKQAYGQPCTIVLGTHGEEAYWTEKMLEFLKAQNLLQHIDAIAIAPYMGDDPNFNYTSVNEYFEHPTAGILNRTAVCWDERGKKHLELAKKYGKKLTFYEFGIGVNKNTAIAQQAQSDTRMGEVVTRYLSHVPKDVEAACWFNLATPWQSNPWGLASAVNEKPAKYQAAATQN